MLIFLSISINPFKYTLKNVGKIQPPDIIQILQKQSIPFYLNTLFMFMFMIMFMISLNTTGHIFLSRRVCNNVIYSTRSKALDVIGVLRGGQGGLAPPP